MKSISVTLNTHFYGSLHAQLYGSSRDSFHGGMHASIRDRFSASFCDNLGRSLYGLHNSLPNILNDNRSNALHRSLL